jgi:tryptophan-rich sensory protein
MFSEHVIVILIAIASVSVVAMIGGLLTDVGDWYASLRKPAWNPPNWAFGPGWTVIFVCIAISGVRAWEHAQDDSTRKALAILFGINAVLNIAWSPLFFKLRRPDWAIVELIPFWLSIFALVIFIAAISPMASLIMLPYLAWVTFAGLLNWRVVQLNKPFGRGTQPTVGRGGRFAS